MSDMKVKSVSFDFSDDQGGESKDWKLSFDHATFTHNNACEFIYHIGCEEAIPSLKENGFSDEFIKECELAKKDGYNYICLYDGQGVINEV